MKQNVAVEQFLAGRRVVIAKFVAHRYKEVQNKAKKPVGVVNLYEVQCADGKAPTVQTWCPRSVQTIEQAASQQKLQHKASGGHWSARCDWGVSLLAFLASLGDSDLPPYWRKDDPGIAMRGIRTFCVTVTRHRRPSPAALGEIGLALLLLNAS